MPNLPKFVIGRLQGSAASESHPDADLLAAFAERGLSGQERSLMIDHLARCGDCREILAVVATAEPEIELKALPSSRPTRPWFAWPALRWGALAAGIVIVASVGVLEYGYHHQAASVASNTVSNQASVNRPLTEPVRDQEKLQIDTSNAQIADGTLQSTSKNATTGNRSATARVNRQHELGSAAQAELNQLAQNQAEPPLNGRDATNLDVVKAKNPVPSQTSSTTAAPSAAPGTLSQLSPPPASRALRRWAINSGTLQRSGDEGKTWENVNPAPETALEFFAISVNGLEVWVGGSGGTLLHTTDSGDHWTRVTPSAAGVDLTGNVVGIQFSDLQHGTIATSTSETWVTSDGGQTWLKQQ
jgi:hypothetical protein